MTTTFDDAQATAAAEYAAVVAQVAELNDENALLGSLHAQAVVARNALRREFDAYKASHPDPAPTDSHWPTRTLWGACIANPGGSSKAAAETLSKKWGHPLVGRQFMGSASLASGPWLPDDVLLMITTWNPTDADVNSGKLDTAIDAMLLRAAATPCRHVVGLRHESNNDGLTDAQITARINACNRIYERKEALGLGDKVLVTQIFTGGFFASYGTDKVRDRWLAQAKGDVIGVDCDAVHTKVGPVYKTDYADELANAKRYLEKYAANGWKWIVVAEFGTSRQPWDTTGQPRANWLAEQSAVLDDPLVLAVCAFDYNTKENPGGPGKSFNRLELGTPEGEFWQRKIAENVA